MSVGADQAIDAARRCARSRASLRWSEESISVSRATVCDRDCWIVGTDAPADDEPGRPPWFDIFTDTRTAYLVEVEGGQCIGVRVGQSLHWFPTGPR